MYEGNGREQSELSSQRSACALRTCSKANNEQGPVCRSNAGQLEDVSLLNGMCRVLTASSDTIKGFAFLPRTSS